MKKPCLIAQAYVVVDLVFVIALKLWCLRVFVPLRSPPRSAESYEEAFFAASSLKSFLIVLGNDTVWA